MIPEKDAYIKEDELVDEFCRRVKCKECFDTLPALPAIYEPYPCGCQATKKFVKKNTHLIREDG